MKISVKLLSLFTMLLFLVGLPAAQSQLITVSQIGKDIKRVIEDYPNRFASIKGNIIVQNPQSAEYECNFKVYGAEESTITFYKSNNNNVCSWQALMYSSDNFEEAKKKYKELYQQLNNLAVQFNGQNSLLLKGEYDEPKEEKKFAGSLLSIYPVDEAHKRLKVEVSFQYELMEWKIRILVYDREREDHERGNRIDN